MMDDLHISISSSFLVFPVSPYRNTSLEIKGISCEKTKGNHFVLPKLHAMFGEPNIGTAAPSVVVFDA